MEGIGVNKTFIELNFSDYNEEVSAEDANKAKNTILIADNTIGYLSKATSIMGIIQNTLKINSNMVVKLIKMNV